jgi:hypothetical protein
MIQSYIQNAMAPNVVVHRLTLLRHIREVQDSNVGPETAYPEVFRGISQSLHMNVCIGP